MKSLCWPLIASLAIAGTAEAQDASYFNVERLHATCLRDNALQYSALEPIIIDLSLCPDLVASTDLSEASLNAFVPNIATDRVEGTTDRYVAYTATQLECLSKLVVDERSEIVRLPKDPKC